MERHKLLNAITDLQDELARDEIDSRHVPRRAAMSRQTYLREPGGLRTQYLQDATGESLAAFLEHLEVVRPRWENEKKADELLASMEMTPTLIKKLEKALKRAKGA